MSWGGNHDICLSEYYWDFEVDQLLLFFKKDVLANARYLAFLSSAHYITSEYIDSYENQQYFLFPCWEPLKDQGVNEVRALSR